MTAKQTKQTARSRALTALRDARLVIMLSVAYVVVVLTTVGALGVGSWVARTVWQLGRTVLGG